MTSKIKFNPNFTCIFLIVFVLLLFNGISHPAREVDLTLPQQRIWQNLLSPPKGTKQSSVVNPQFDPYKLIYPKNYKGKIKLKVSEIDAARHSRYNSFLEQLNLAGSQGYKLMSAVNRFSYPVAVVRFDEGKYEYAWFETVSHNFFSKEGFKEQFADQAKQGFRLVEHFNIYTSCEPEGEISYDEKGTVNLRSPVEKCVYEDLFLLERETGVNQSVQYSLAFNSPRWKARMDEELTELIEKKMAEGIYPTTAFSRFELLLQQPVKRDELVTDNLEVKVVTKPNLKFGGVQKKINELAKQGFRIALISNDIAVMYRDSKTATAVLYSWLKVNKDLNNQLLQLQANKAIYRMTYPDNQGRENELIFEQRGTADEEHREYRILKFSFQEQKNSALGQVQIELTPTSKKALEDMHHLINEGFRIKDIFGVNEPGLILER